MIENQKPAKSCPCPGRESNPHGRFGPRDFKSLVSTISPPGQKGRSEGAERSAKIRIISENGNAGFDLDAKGGREVIRSSA